jgi:O-antigen/teichoic acid export membrane protein
MSNESQPGEIGYLQRLLTALRSRHTLRSHIWQSLAVYVAQGFGLVFGVIMARILYPADFGAFGFAAASVFLALLPATWTLNPMLVADAGRTPALHAKAASFAWCVGFVRFTIVAAIVCWFYFRGRPQTALLCLLFGISESWRELNYIQRYYLEGLGIFKPNLISALLGILFCLTVVVPVGLLGWGPFTLTLPGIGTVCIDFFLYRHYSGRSVFVKPAWNLGRDIFREGFWMWLIRASEEGLNRLDSWFIGKFRGDIALGFYNRAFGYAPISHLLLNSFVTSPTVVGLARCETTKARRWLLVRTAAIVLAGGLVNWVAFFFFARPIVLFVFGPKWEGAIPIFHAFASLSLAYALAYLPVTLLWSAGRYREIALVRASCLALFAAALFLFPGTRSAISVAWLVQAAWLLQGLVLLVPSLSLLADPQTSQATFARTASTIRGKTNQMADSEDKYF